MATWRKGHTRTDPVTGKVVQVTGHPLRTRPGGPAPSEDTLDALAAQAATLATPPELDWDQAEADLSTEDAPGPTVERLAADVGEIHQMMEGINPRGWGWDDADNPGQINFHSPLGRHITLRFLEQRITSVGADIAAVADQRAAPEIARIRAEYERIYGDLEEAYAYTRRAVANAEADVRLWEGRLAEKTHPDAAERLALHRRSAMTEHHDLRECRMEIARRDGEILGATRAATLDVLKALRPLGAPPEGVISHAASQRPAAAIAAQAAEIYPTDWMQRSNDHPRRIVFRRSRTRAHYRHRHPVDTADPAGPLSRPVFRSKRSWDEAPPVPDAQDYFDRSKGRMAWHWNENYRSEAASEITVDMSTGPVPKTTPGFPTAAHELAHRHESLNPVIGAMEWQFLLRRATDPATDSLPEKEPISPVKGETGYPDGFVIPYVGRVYPLPEETIFSSYSQREETGDCYEVLSVGVEAVFAGRYGGLVGHDGWKADEDHRAFVLGALATL